MPPSTGLSGTQFSTLNSAGINDPEGTEKYSTTEDTYGATFYSCHTALDTCCCEVYKSGNKVIPLKHFTIVLVVPLSTLRGVDGSLHLTVPFMNRLNQTEPATFSVMSC
jgi:hypothetical protein